MVMLTDKTKMNMMSVVALSLTIASLTSDFEFRRLTLMGQPVLFGLFGLTGLYFAFYLLKQRAWLKEVWSAKEWNKEDYNKLKTSVLMLALVVATPFLMMNESSWLFESYYTRQRSFCLFPSCIEGRGIGVYFVAGLAVFLVYKTYVEQKLKRNK